MHQKVERILKTYCRKGWFLFPINPASKHPCIKNMLMEASDDIGKLIEWEKQFPKCNWGLSLAKSGLVAVDVDTRHGGMEVWSGFIGAMGEPDTLIQTTGTGGLHYVFQADKTKRYRGKIRKGIDVKYNGYVILYPSINRDTDRRYTWRNWGQEPNPAPDYIADLIIKDTRSGKHTPSYKFGNQYIEKLVKSLKEYELSYEEWVQAGMAIHATDPSHEGLSLYMDLTQGVSYVDGDLDKAERKWESFSETEDGVTPLTLGYLVRKKGGVVPNPSFEEDIKAFKRAKIQSFNVRAEKDPSEDWEEIPDIFEKKGEHWICRKNNLVVDWFNDRGFAFLESGSNACYLKLGTDKKTGSVNLKTMTERGLAEMTAPYMKLDIKETPTDVKAVESPAYLVWKCSRRRTSFSDIVFRPEANEGELNLWEDIKMEPISGVEPKAILDMIRLSLCGSDERKYNWFLDWLAHIVQRPGDRATVVPVLISKQGTGKGLLMDYVMAPILGARYTVITSSAELMARFNIKLSRKWLTFIDEATWRGNKTEDGVLKRLTGSPTMTVEEKFGAQYDIENFSRYLVASNNTEAVALEVGNRRYVLIVSALKYADDLAFFEPIAEAIREGTIVQEFYGFLLDRDISEFKPHEILRNNMAGQESKIATEGPVAMFWEDTFFENPKRLWDPIKGLQTTVAFEEFLGFCARIRTYEKAITPKGFWSKTRRLIPKLPAANVARCPESTRLSRFIYMQPGAMCNGFIENLEIKRPDHFSEEDYYLETFDEVEENLSDL